MKVKILAASIAMSIALSGCGGSDDSGSSNNGNDGVATEYKLNGYTEKGPYQPASVVTIQELDQNLQQTGISYTTQTYDYFGEYDVSANLGSSLVEMFIDGYFFNEVTNAVDEEKLIMSAYVDLSLGSNVNLSITTALIKDLVKKLYDEGKTFEQANIEATQALLDLYGYGEYDAADFYQVTLHDGGDESAILLAISALTIKLAEDDWNTTLTQKIHEISKLLANPTEAEYTALEAEILEKNGELSNVDSNMAQYFEANGKEFNISPFPFFIRDENGDFVDRSKPIFLDGGIGVATVQPSEPTYYEYETKIEAYDEQGRELTYQVVQKPTSFGEVELIQSNGEWYAHFKGTLIPSDQNIENCFTIDTVHPEPSSNQYWQCRMYHPNN